MKKTFVATILALTTAGAAYGQGHLLISNYQEAPYSQVVWSPTGPAVTAADGLTFQVFYGNGVITNPSQLTPGTTFQIDNTFTTSVDPGAGHGPGGYFINVDQVFPWSPGQTETFMYEVILPGLLGRSALWQENTSIVSTANPPQSSQSVGLVIVPEPSTFALAAFGTVSFLISRRRT